MEFSTQSAESFNFFSLFGFATLLRDGASRKEDMFKELISPQHFTMKNFQQKFKKKDIANTFMYTLPH